MADIYRFPGAGTPAPGGTPPTLAVDLDGVADRYTAYREAVTAGDGYAARLLAMACADDIPGMQAEITRLTVELDRVRAGGVR